MDNFTINSPENAKRYDWIVDYRNNKCLLENGVSFHWWGAEDTSLHCHNFYEFFIVTDGKAIHELNGKVSTIGKGELFMLRPEDCHRFRMVDGCTCSHMNLCATEECFHRETALIREYLYFELCIFHMLPLPLGRKCNGLLD